MHFKKLRDILSSKISEIEFSLSLCCLKQIIFFGSFDELKSIKYVNLLLFECQSTSYEKAVKVLQKWH